MTTQPGILINHILSQDPSILSISYSNSLPLEDSLILIDMALQSLVISSSNFSIYLSLCSYLNSFLNHYYSSFKPNHYSLFNPQDIESKLSFSTVSKYQSFRLKILSIYFPSISSLLLSS